MALRELQGICATQTTGIDRLHMWEASSPGKNSTAIPSEAQGLHVTQ